jgi:glycosyltransferase involved in cell wall biosynthesis
VNNFKLTESIQFLGYVENLFNYYKLFDIILFTSEWEGMPFAMWEAMVNEVPVVAPDIGGFKEILEENNCGLIYKPADLNDAEEKIIKIINDEQFKKYLGENGKKAVEKKYNEKKFITEIEQVYLSLI